MTKIAWGKPQLIFARVLHRLDPDATCRLKCSLKCSLKCPLMCSLSANKVLLRCSLSLHFDRAEFFKPTS